MLCSHAQPDKQVSATVKNISFVVKETTQGVKRKLCGKTFAQEVFFILHPFTRGGEEWNSQS